MARVPFVELPYVYQTSPLTLKWSDLGWIHLSQVGLGGAR